MIARKERQRSKYHLDPAKEKSRSQLTLKEGLSRSKIEFLDKFGMPSCHSHGIEISHFRRQKE